MLGSSWTYFDSTILIKTQKYMSATLFTIDKIEGNSNIGVPVFSRQAIKKNHEYICLSPQKAYNAAEKQGVHKLVEPELERFKIA